MYKYNTHARIKFFVVISFGVFSFFDKSTRLSLTLNKIQIFSQNSNSFVKCSYKRKPKRCPLNDRKHNYNCGFKKLDFYLNILTRIVIRLRTVNSHRFLSALRDKSVNLDGYLLRKYATCGKSTYYSFSIETLKHFPKIFKRCKSAEQLSTGPVFRPTRAAIAHLSTVLTYPSLTPGVFYLFNFV